MSPNKIVITGTIASGKSTLSEILRKKGFLVIDSDKVNKDLLKKGEKNYLAIKNEKNFDKAFCDDKLDKKKLAEIIFASKEKRELLNKLTHKNIIDKINQIVENSEKKYVFIEIPLYFSMKEKFPNQAVRLVMANEEIQVERLMKRDKIDRKYALKKIESQKNKEEMKKNSSYIFDNSKDYEYLEGQVNLALNELEKK